MSEDQEPLRLAVDPTAESDRDRLIRSPPEQHGVYPNPTTSATWTDELGRLWHRRGERGWSLDEKRTRRLLRSESVPLATWDAGTIEWFTDAPAKQAAADRLHTAAKHPTNIHPSEWKSTDGTHLLMLEHLC